MEQATQVKLIEWILGNVDAGTRDMDAGEARNPVSDYIDEHKHRFEIETLFRTFPILIAHGSELRHPGDFVTHEETGVPILLVRNDAGRVNAFINVCRHRGAIVEPKRKGLGRMTFACPYHAWTYDREGTLIGITDAEGFESIQAEPCSLVRLPVEERYGFVWVRPSPGAPIDIADYLGPLAADFEGHGLETNTLYKPDPGHVHEMLARSMNWKLMVDTFLEAYHFRYTHTKSVYPLFTDNVATYERFGRHLRIVVPKRTMLDLKGAPRMSWRLRDHCILMYYVFPNTVIVFMADHVSVFAMFPAAPEESVLLLTFYLPEEPNTEKAWAYWRKNADMIRSALAEDFEIGEGAQRGFHSGANTHLTYGRFEKGLAHFHETVNAELAKAGYNGP